jgi:DNA-binding IclR family transcriptional regulator
MSTIFDYETYDLAKSLTERQAAVLDIIASHGGEPVYAMQLALEMVRRNLDTSEQGVHRTAASLVRKVLLRRDRGKYGVGYRATGRGTAVDAKLRQIAIEEKEARHAPDG